MKQIYDNIYCEYYLLTFKDTSKYDDPNKRQTY